MKENHKSAMAAWPAKGRPETQETIEEKHKAAKRELAARDRKNREAPYKNFNIYECRVPAGATFAEQREFIAARRRREEWEEQQTRKLLESILGPSEKAEITPEEVSPTYKKRMQTLYDRGMNLQRIAEIFNYEVSFVRKIIGYRCGKEQPNEK